MKRIFLLATILTVILADVALPTLQGNANTFMLNGDVKLIYSIYNNMINVVVTVTNKGGIGVGLGGMVMANVDVAHFWYDGSKVQLADRNYINPTGPAIVLTDVERGGTSDFVDNGTTYDTATGNWVINFSRKLNTNDKYDNPVVDGTNMQVSVAEFPSHTWGAQHTVAFYQTIPMTSKVYTGSMSNCAQLGFMMFVLIGLLSLI
ncbi:hypothetical protein ABPG74_006612 [Tetrahymena malaccensis]